MEFPLAYTTEKKYDELGTAGFPNRCGLDIHAILPEIDIAVHADFLQAWLFFGTLHEVLGIFFVEFNQDDFKKLAPDGKELLTTAQLPMYIWYCAASETRLPQSTKGHRARRLQLLLEQILIFVAHAIQLEKRREIPGHAVMIPVSILCETLSIAAHVIFGIKNMRWDVPQALLDRMCKAGWCLGEIEYLDYSQIGCCSFFLLGSTIKPDDGKDHGRCADGICDAYQLDESTYETKHVDSECRCMHKPSSNDTVGKNIADVLDNGRIPVCTVTILEHGGVEKLKIEVVDSSMPVRELFIWDKIKQRVDAYYSQGVKYVAISHVWSDGMGNTKGNTLPTCLLKQLQQKVQRLYPEELQAIPFWIDTFCVPRERRLRNIAVRGLARVYAQADAVLVMDQSLQRLGAENSSAPERLLYSRICPWTTRLWTLQEGWLAQKLFYDFKDKSSQDVTLIKEWIHGDGPTKLNIKNLAESKGKMQRLNPILRERLIRALVTDASSFHLDPAKQKILVDHYRKIHPDLPTPADLQLSEWINKSILFDPVYLDSCISIARIRRERESPPDERCGAILSALQGRRTSRSDDEAICIANLMEIDPQEIIVAPAEKRIILLLRKLKRLPTAIIFTHLARLNSTDFTWAPASFLDRGATSFASPSLAQLDEEGLNVNLPGVQLCLATNLPHSNQMLVKIDEWLLVLILFESSGTSMFWDSYQKIQHPMIILRESLKKGERGPVDGVLTEKEKYVDGKYFVAYKRTIWIKQGFGDEVVGTGKWLSSDSKWCFN